MLAVFSKMNLSFSLCPTAIVLSIGLLPSMAVVNMAEPPVMVGPV